MEKVKSKNTENRNSCLRAKNTSDHKGKNFTRTFDHRSREWELELGIGNNIIITVGSNGALGYLGRIAAHVIIAQPGTAKGGIRNLLFRDPFNSSTGDKVTDLVTQKDKQSHSGQHRAWDGDTGNTLS